MSCSLYAPTLSPVRWSLKQDNDGHRTYSVTLDVICTNRQDGPAMALTATGLPALGSYWAFGNDVDLYAYRVPESSAQPKASEAHILWSVDLSYTNKPLERCTSSGVFQNPLLEPPKFTGDFEKGKIEGVVDRLGNPILNSAHEQIRGPVNEWDDSTLIIRIESNVAAIDHLLLNKMIDTVNDAPLWGFPAGSVKLTDAPWEEKYSSTCIVYYTLKLEFKIRYKEIKKAVPGEPGQVVDAIEDWSRDILDEGTKVLHGHWRGEDWVLDPIDYQYDEDGIAMLDETGLPLFVFPDFHDPGHFERFKDRRGENARVILDGFGEPYSPGRGVSHDPGIWGVFNPADLSFTVLTDATWADARSLYPAPIELYGPYKTSADANAAFEAGDTGLLADTDPGGRPGEIHVDKYTRSNFLLLGIPTVIG